MFELALAAQLRLNGAEVTIGEPDITITLSGKPFIVECKRPFRVESIRSNVRDAADQLYYHLEGNSEAGGIVAVSATRLLNPGGKVFVARKESDKKLLGDRLQQVMREAEPGWVKHEFHPRVCGILFHVRTPGVVEDQDLLIMASYVIASPVGREYRFDLLKPVLPAWLGK